ncbi:MAG: glycoside hydrolase family 99-like domain-containing protein [Alphaproteobacteria bacterium]|nr:glycoside hydrolase family 99-like domain-containing protein [Alphaproteobacteria bacterium]
MSGQTLAPGAIMRAHRLLCSPFISDEEFRAALGGSRADLTTIGRYLMQPVAERPAISPFFDRAFYRATNPDIADADADPLLHFIETGLAELRAPHPLIDLRFITLSDPLVLGTPPAARALFDLLDWDLAAPSPYFDPQEYRARLGEAAPPHGMLLHFLNLGLASGLSANPLMDHAWYATRYDDVRPDPYEALRHFIVLGDLEGRAASPRFNGALYRARYPDVAVAGVPPLWHFLTHGRVEGRQVPADTLYGESAPPRRPIATGAAVPATPQDVLRAHGAITATLQRARQARQDSAVVTAPAITPATSPAADIARLRFPAVTAPRLSILVPMYNEIDVTIDCLHSVLNTGGTLAYEVILADDCSTDPDALLFDGVENLVVIRQPTNQGFIRNCNAAFARCRGEYVLLLNNDAQVMPGALAAMVAALDADSMIGAAGPKIIYPNGRLQEAGCYVRPNGESGMVGLFADPSEPGYCYDRDIAYSSGAALLVRRALVGPILFDEAFRPAYCEDVDLCLRLIDAGYRVRYVHNAVVLHHLSVSTNRESVARKMRTIVANQHKLVERWGPLIRGLDRVRVLAFYIPQFHPTPENDLWWGKGFTEWTNVAKAQPSFLGHYQPHLPADLGFYDLRAADALRAQAALAARYGIEGFCVYYYNFGARRVLSKPLDTVRANPDIPFNWCICWANENWTRHWDGGEKAILLEQSYDTATLASIIADAVDQATDDRYIRVDGKPLFLVYRPLLLPNPTGFAADCRRAFEAAGFPGVHLAYVESMEAVNKALRPADIGFDAAIEFPPHGLAVPCEDSAEITKDGWTGYRYDYPETVAAFVSRETVAYPRYPTIFPSWDNTPRQPLRGTSFDNASPEVFRAYAEAKIDEIRSFHMRDERLLFVNAWNEWAEGAHLEPDAGYGHRWLEALRDAVTAKRWS